MENKHLFVSIVIKVVLLNTAVCRYLIRALRVAQFVISVFMFSPQIFKPGRCYHSSITSASLVKFMGKGGISRASSVCSQMNKSSGYS
jgi:hypothetical protein